MTLALTTPTIAAEPTPARADRRRTAAAATVAGPSPDVALDWDPGSPDFARWAAGVGQQIDQHGLMSIAPAIDHLVILADQLGVAPVAARVLADPAETEPARLRALGCVLRAVRVVQRRKIS